MTTRNEARLHPFRLGAQFVERVWGRTNLAPWYRNPLPAKVGEAWLTGESCLVETGPHAGKRLSQMDLEFRESLLGRGHSDFPLLVKILFPQEKLSVQVHPDTAQAIALGGGARAKTECWYVLDAEPGAAVSLGLKPGTTKAMVQDALGNVAFEDLLHVEQVTTGDMLYVEAGTVHAIGPGLVILEVQQSSDTTYRLYDYGRPRELHLEDGGSVIKMHTASGKVDPLPIAGGLRLIDVEHFIVDRFSVPANASIEGVVHGAPQCLVGLSGHAQLISEGGRVDLLEGQAVVVPASCAGYTVAGEGSFVRCHLPPGGPRQG